MQREDYKYTFAKSITLKIILPMFVILDVIFIILFSLGDGKVIYNILLTTTVIIVLLVVVYYIMLFIGSHLFKTHNFNQDNEYFYYKKIKLKKDNLKYIRFSYIGEIYNLEFIPIKNGIFKSCRIIYYFTNYTELIEFIMRNHLLALLDKDSRSAIEINRLFKGWNIDKYGNMVINKYPCPCCGYLTFSVKPGGTFDICPVCYWEDDDLSIEEPNTIFDINKVSLNKARDNFKSIGACREEDVPYVRKPYEYEIPDGN